MRQLHASDHHGQQSGQPEVLRRQPGERRPGNSGPITATTTVWIYDETGTVPNCFDEESFTVTINNTPSITNPGPQTACDSYTLPTITGSNLVAPKYYDDSQANGGQEIVGPITATTTVWIYDETGTAPNCSDEESFTVTINLTPSITNPGPQTACDSYTLPTITGSNLVAPKYYDDSQANGGQEILGPITSSMTVWIYDETGTAPNCSDEESFTVTINLTPSITNPGPQTACDSYTLPTITGSNLVNPKYYDDSQANGGQEIVGPITATTTVWIYDETGTAPNCFDEESFVVTINLTPSITNPGPQTACDSYTLPTITGSNLVNPKYYDDSQANGGQEIVGPITSSTTVWIYDETGTVPNCFDEESFVVTINLTPSITNPGPQTACDSYTLPTITGSNLVNPKYYDDSQANGGQEIVGPITSSMTVWIYDETGTVPNCFDEESFTVTINLTPSITNPGPQTACDSYTLPTITGSNLVAPKYYDDSQANGGQEILGPITATTTVWIYDETGTAPNCSDEESFTVTINNTPSITNPGPQTACDSYTLLTITGSNLVNPKYYDDSQANGGQEIVGPITSSMTVWIYDETGTVPNCSDEESFTVTINNTPSITNPGPQTACDSYTLPTITGSNLVAPKYYDDSQANGGQEILGPITSSMTVWIYDETGTAPNCSDEESFTVTINLTPSITNPGPQTACDSYTLPTITGSNLVNPKYYDDSQANGGQEIVGPITATTTVWIYDETGTAPNCFDEESFVVTINLTPSITNPGPQTACDSYTLPTITGSNLVNPKYYDDSQANGGQEIVGPITSSTTVWIYDETGTVPNCFDEESFTVTINLTPSITNPGPQTACDSYTLPTITGSNLVNPKYYDDSQANGGQEIVGPITATTTVWIYDETGTAPNCFDEESFVVTINLTPSITNPGPQTACDSYTLPTITGSNLVNPKYYDDSQANGGQEILGPITATTTVWIYDETGTVPNCFDEESFVVTINLTPSITNPGPQTACDSYTLPTITGSNLVAPKYYDDSQANGGQEIVGPITSSTTVWIYDETGTAPNCFDEESFTVTINLTPSITNPGPQTACDSYTLPTITGSNLVAPKYYDDSQANGGQEIVGPITATTTVWIYDETGTAPNCSDEESFVVTINLTPSITNPGPQTACDSYTLPTITGSDLVNPKYYDDSQANGGQEILGPITATTTVWIYDETGTVPNCSDEESFVVTINLTPSITNPGPQTACDSYTLPTITGSDLVNPKYYDDSQANGGQEILGPITATTTVWIYDETGTVPNCSDEESFVVTINLTPSITNPGPQTACDSYTLPTITGSNLVNPKYYDDSQANGGQEILGPITATTTVWIYDETGTAPNCSDEESFTVTINNTPSITNPGPQTACDSYTLPTITGSNLVNPKYYDDSQANGGQEIVGPITATTTVWIYDETGTAPNCSDEESFVVTINNTPSITNPGPQTACDSYTLPTITGSNLVNPKYYDDSQANGGQEILGPITATTTVWIYDETGTVPNCFDEESFTVTINNTPSITNPGPQTACDSYTLPTITGSNLVAPKYYDDSQANGGQEIVGPITSSMTVWIYDETGTVPNCSDEESFTVTINLTPSITNPGPQTACDSYTLPTITGSNLVNPKYYDDSQANGGQEIVGPITSSTTVWIYDETGTAPNCSDEESFTVTINLTPSITNPGPQTACDSYTLPTITGSNLVNPKYYDDSQANGGQEIVGPITSSTTVWIYDETGTVPNCSDEESFTVTINLTPSITNPGPQTACDSYTLPTITGSNLVAPKYYDDSQANGGQEIVGPITSSMTVWIYDETGTVPNCSDEESFTVTINLTPSITNPGPQTACDSYTLPTITGSNLVNPKYYDDSQANGGQEIVGPITSSTTVWIYDETGTAPNCSDEESFTVTINLTPSITNPGPQTACDSYTLPTITGSNLVAPKYYDDSQANGGQEIVGPITSSMTVWIYDETGTVPNCSDEESFTVTINLTPSITNPGPQTACDSYTLPTITGSNLVNPKYYDDSQANGGQEIVGPITSSTTVWIYDETGTAPNCSDEESFVVTINNTPSITNPGPQTACDSYTLPTITGSNLVNPKYYDDSQANGGQEIVGPITSSMTVWIYDETGTAPNCFDEESFTVTINLTPSITNPGPQTACDSYTLPTITGSNLVAPKYYDDSQANGGQEIVGPITSSMTVWIYDETGTAPNCSDEESFVVTITPCAINFSGRIIWEATRLTTMTGVNEVTTNLTGDDTDTDLTGATGDFLLVANSGSDFELTPVKNVPMPFALNGVTTADASRITQHALNILPITDPYKLIAADVNTSNSITTADASFITQAVLGNPVFQLAFINKTWRFVPKDYVFPIPASPWGYPQSIVYTGISGDQTDQDFIGVKMGDVNNTANPANFGGQLAPNLIWRVQDRLLQQGETFVAEFRADNLYDLLAYQFGMLFDVTKLELLEIETIPGSPMSEDNFGIYNLAAGEIRAALALAQAITLEDGTAVFRLKFKVLEGGSKLSTVLHITNDVLLAEAYRSDYTPGPVSLVYGGITTSTGEPEMGKLELLQNRPNPFQGRTVIGFELPGACDATLRVFDTKGRLLRERSAFYPAGSHQVEFDFGTERETGVLYYDLTTPFGVLAKKMVLTRE
ncbi:MAG: hypothetical protein KIS77_00375 [Saprospiraceae bacterium]|nr:hypothetical protein [Saprospiraceae bacterium]